MKKRVYVSSGLADDGRIEHPARKKEIISKRRKQPRDLPTSGSVPIVRRYIWEEESRTVDVNCRERVKGGQQTIKATKRSRQEIEGGTNHDVYPQSCRVQEKGSKLEEVSGGAIAFRRKHEKSCACQAIMATADCAGGRLQRGRKESLRGRMSRVVFGVRRGGILRRYSLGDDSKTSQFRWTRQGGYDENSRHAGIGCFRSQRRELALGSCRRASKEEI